MPMLVAKLPTVWCRSPTVHGYDGEIPTVCCEKSTFFFCQKKNHPHLSHSNYPYHPRSHLILSWSIGFPTMGLSWLIRIPMKNQCGLPCFIFSPHFPWHYPHRSILPCFRANQPLDWLKEKLPETSIFHGKIDGFRWRWLPAPYFPPIKGAIGPPHHFPLTTWLASRQDVWRAARDASETKNGEFNQQKWGFYHQQQDLTSKNHEMAIKHGDLSDNNWDLTNKKDLATKK